MVKLFATRIHNTISDSEYYQLIELVSSERRRRTKSYRNRGDALRTLIGEVLIRSVISTQVHIPYQSIQFTQNKYGKPRIEGLLNLHFNISHSGEWVVAALSNYEVGIDIEKIEPVDMEIASHFFSPIELGHLRELDSGDRLSRFYELWTLKESYIKCVGQGLHLPLNSFSIITNQEGNIELMTSNNVNKTYYFSQFPLDRNYKLAVCSEETCSIEIKNIDITELIQNMCISHAHF